MQTTRDVDVVVDSVVCCLPLESRVVVLFFRCLVALEDEEGGAMHASALELVKL